MDDIVRESARNIDPSDDLNCCGFGNHFESEAMGGALPRDQNSPQRCAYGLYAEQLSGSAFTAPRAENRRTWTYRIQPSVRHQPYRPLAKRRFLSGPFVGPALPAQLRWSPFDMPAAPTDFIDGISTIGGNGEPDAQIGMAIHIYASNRSMTNRVFCDADGELLIVPQSGSLRLFTELGILTIKPGEIAVIPAGLRFRVELPQGTAIGYMGKTTARCCGFRSSVPSGPTVSPIRVISERRPPHSSSEMSPSS